MMAGRIRRHRVGDAAGSAPGVTWAGDWLVLGAADRSLAIPMGCFPCPNDSAVAVRRALATGVAVVLSRRDEWMGSRVSAGESSACGARLVERPDAGPVTAPPRAPVLPNAMERRSSRTLGVASHPARAGLAFWPGVQPPIRDGET